jgi:hypothetical protein
MKSWVQPAARNAGIFTTQVPSDRRNIEMDDARKTDRLRLRFAAALALYFLWVAALVAMAVLSSTRPAATKPGNPMRPPGTSLPRQRLDLLVRMVWQCLPIL